MSLRPGAGSSTAALAAAAPSTIAAPGPIDAGGVSYGNALVVVTGASGSFARRRSCQTPRPSCWPSFACSAPSSLEERTSPPPPRPNTLPSSAATAATSVSVQGLALLPDFLYCAFTPAT